jgi:hypothetical protein
MAAPIYAKESVVEPIIGNLLDKVADVPHLTISSLIEEIFNLLNQPVIQQDQEAKSLLSDRLKQISARNGMEPIQKSEQVFYNFSQQLVDRQGRLNRHCLDMLKEISLEKPSLNKKQALQIELQEMHKEINRLKEKLGEYTSGELQEIRKEITMLKEKHTSMVPISISMPITNGTHQIPAQIPQDATHALLSVSKRFGQSRTQYCVTLSNSRNQQYYFSYSAGECNGYHFFFASSENIWMEICPLRQITISGNDYGYLSTISIIGYK